MDMCDLIYVYDQGSDDGSLDILRKNPKVRLIESPYNDFSNENVCKRALLKKLLEENPDTSWILWMDCDYLLSNNVLENGFSKFFDIIKEAEADGSEALAFGHYNLWRSDLFFRTDDNYHASHEGGRISLWKNNGKLEFLPLTGLHKSPLPQGLGKYKRVDCSLIHRGFATDYQIITKYNIYKSFGQRGWELERLLNENGLSVSQLPDGMLPDWFEPQADKTDPRIKEKLRSILARGGNANR
jgi:hypothetical protein